MSDDTQLLVGDWTPFQPGESAVITESNDGSLVGRGVFGYCDKPTRNGRVYPKSLIENEIKRLKEQKIIQRRMFRGELEHPEEGTTSLRRVSHYIPDLKVEDNGMVLGEMVVMEGTRDGKQLQAILDSGAVVGVSSRGVGTTETIDEGHQRVKNDYDLIAYDAVDDPSVREALPEFQYESTRSQMMESVKKYSHEREDNQWKGYSLSDNDTKTETLNQTVSNQGTKDMDLETLKEESPEQYKRLMEEARSEVGTYAENLEKNLSEVKSKVREEVKQDMPEARIVETLKEELVPVLREDADIEKEVQREIQELKSENRELRQKIDEKQNLVEDKDQKRKLSEFRSKVATHIPHIVESAQPKFMDLLGDPKDYETVDKFDERLSSVVDNFKDQNLYIEDIQEVVNENIEHRANLQQKDHLLQEAQKSLEQLEAKEEKLDEAVDTIKELKQMNEAKREKMARKDEVIEDAKQEVTSLRNKVSDKASKVSNLKESVRDLKSRANELQNKVSDKDEKIERLQQKVRQVESRNQELELEVKRYEEIKGSSTPNKDYERVRDADSEEEIEERLNRRRNRPNQNHGSRRNLNENNRGRRGRRGRSGRRRGPKPGTPNKSGDEGNIDDMDMDEHIAEKIHGAAEGEKPKVVTEGQQRRSNQNIEESRNSGDRLSQKQPQEHSLLPGSATAKDIEELV